MQGVSCPRAPRYVCRAATPSLAGLAIRASDSTRLPPRPPCLPCAADDVGGSRAGSPPRAGCIDRHGASLVGLQGGGPCFLLQRRRSPGVGPSCPSLTSLLLPVLMSRVSLMPVSSLPGRRRRRPPPPPHHPHPTPPTDQHQQPGARAAHQEQDGASNHARGDGEAYTRGGCAATAAAVLYCCCTVLHLFVFCERTTGPGAVVTGEEGRREEGKKGGAAPAVTSADSSGGGDGAPAAAMSARFHAAAHYGVPPSQAAVASVIRSCVRCWRSFWMMTQT